jgi:hypothetical protein
MARRQSLLKLLGKRTCACLALALLGICVLLLFLSPLFRFAPYYSLRAWEIGMALFLSFQTIFAPLLQSRVRSFLPLSLSQRWISSLIIACLFSIPFLLIFFLLGASWSHVLVVFSGPLMIALVAVTLIMMGFYISGRFS